jgi:AcrR family transcriptional regulator
MAKQTNKEKALLALLSTNTVKDAAAECGLSVESLYRYLKEPEFVAEYRAHRRNLMEATIGRIQQAADQAVHTLRRNMGCKNPGVEVRAASIVIDNALRGVELTDILERLEALENEHNRPN